MPEPEPGIALCYPDMELHLNPTRRSRLVFFSVFFFEVTKENNLGGLVAAASSIK